MNYLDRNVREDDMSSIKDMTRIPVEKVLQLKDGREAHGVARQGFYQFGMAPVDVLERLALVLDAGPDEAQIG